jgi:hypothetical protein
MLMLFVCEYLPSNVQGSQTCEERLSEDIDIVTILTPVN